MIRYGGFDVIFASGICAGVAWLDMEVLISPGYLYRCSVVR